MHASAFVIHNIYNAIHKFTHLVILNVGICEMGQHL